VSRSRWLSGLVFTAMLALPASTAHAVPPDVGRFPVKEQVQVLEPESTICGFPISYTAHGHGRFQVFFDAEGNRTRVHIITVTSGELSANGITLRTGSAHNEFISDTSFAETGVVFKYALPGTGVVLMDRGRLVFDVDPELGEPVGGPVFEAGLHPELHGDLQGLCAALTP
jgi:hypothetical protein